MKAQTFIVVVATFRSGSTSVMQMLDNLPGACINGENAGMANILNMQYEASKRTGFHTTHHGAWQHEKVNSQRLLNLQREYINAQLACLPETPTVGFKTIRMRRIEEANHLVLLIPNIQFLLVPCVPKFSQTRNNQTYGRDCKKHNDLIRAMNQANWVHNDRVVGTFSVFTNTTFEFNEILGRVGYPKCQYSCFLHANKCNKKSCYNSDSTKTCLSCSVSTA